MYLVLLETSGNQTFIFSTNKLRENVGASELTYRAGTKWVLDAVAAANGLQGQPQRDRPTAPDAHRLRSHLLNAELNPPIEASSLSVEIIVAASGKALLLVREKDTAKRIIQQVTTVALKDAPGLEVCGVFEEFDWQTNCLSDFSRRLYRQLDQARTKKPGAAMRFSRLPVIAECATSGLPASIWDVEVPSGEPPAARSRVSISKRRVSRDRLKSLVPEGYRFAEDLSQIDADWLAVIHADGNGLGEVFLRFHEHIGATAPTDNRNYVETLRKFSIALDICTENAFLTALAPFLQQDPVIPMVPLILGGDDLTVICEGRTALQFSKRFLQAFEQETARSNLPDVGDVIPAVARAALHTGRLSACAGVAIIKPHFPFSVAYDLAEQLLKVAKKVKQKLTLADGQQPYPCSAIDFHILYDSSGADLEQIRNKLKFEETDGSYYRHNHPYVVTEAAELAAANGFAWSQHHRLETLERQVEAIRSTDNTADGRRKLPSSQLHDLRSGLFLGRAVADARFCLMRDRYLTSNSNELDIRDIRVFEGEANSLFQPEPENDSGAKVFTTGLLDAIDVADFLHASPPTSSSPPIFSPQAPSLQPSNEQA